jgi:hypothetical protein
MSALRPASDFLLVALFPDAKRAEGAARALLRQGLGEDKLSLCARDPRKVAGATSPGGAGHGATSPGGAGHGPVPDGAHQQAVSPDLWSRFSRAVVVRLPELGLAVALGPLAVELTQGPAARGGRQRLEAALRRLGLPSRHGPRLERAVQAGRVLLVATVAPAAAQGWSNLLQKEGAQSLSAHVHLDPWPRDKPSRHPREQHRSLPPSGSGAHTT